MLRLLLIEDDLLLGKGLKEGLRNHNFQVDWFTNGTDGLNAILMDQYFDLIILDLGLPERSGFEILEIVRKKGITTPIIILTANDSQENQINGLSSGADDYVTKPAALEVLIARINNQLRRKNNRFSNEIIVGDIMLNPSSHIVTLNEEEIVLSRREFSVLHKLMEKSGQVVTKDQLSQSIYGWDDVIDSNTIEVYIHNLRKRFKEHLHIKTIRGVGYMVEKT